MAVMFLNVEDGMSNGSDVFKCGGDHCPVQTVVVNLTHGPLRNASEGTLKTGHRRELTVSWYICSLVYVAISRPFLKLFTNYGC